MNSTIQAIPVASDALPAKASKKLSHLPGPNGHWLRGNLPDLLPNPGPFLLEMQRLHGDCFTVGLLRNERVVVWMGATANQSVFQDREQNFSSRLGWEVLTTYFGRNIVTRDFADHRAHRQAMTSVFKASALQQYFQAMQPAIARSVEQCVGEVDIYVHMKRLALEIALQVFAGFDEAQRTDAMYADLSQILDSVMAPRINLPGTLHFKGIRARNRLRRVLLQEVTARRQGNGCDLFTLLARHQDDSGNQLSDQDVVDHMFGIMFAAHDTTASAMAMMLGLLADHPQWQQTLRQEVSALRANKDEASLSLEQVRQLGSVEPIFKETLRLYSPLQLLPRRAVRGFRASGQGLPANTHILLPLQGCHMNPNYFDEPAKFMPERFVDSKLAPFTYIPFGGGAHMCIGMHFALMEVQAVMGELLQQYKVSPTDKSPSTMDYLPVVRPARPLILSFQPIRH